MKILKAALCVLFSTAILISASSRQALAAEGKKYAMALTDDVYLYDEMQRNTELFALPCTYCVQITKEYDEWYRVIYAEDDGFYEKITGYCKKDNLLILDEPPEEYYLNYPVEVVLSSGGGEAPALPGLQITVTAAFYGNFYRADTSYIYLRYNDGFGYIEGEIDDYPQNEVPSSPTFSENGGSTPEQGTSVAAGIIIAVLAAVAVIVLIVTGRKNHSRQ